MPSPNFNYPIGPGHGAEAVSRIGGNAVRYTPGLGWVWSVRCTVGAGRIGATALASATSQEIDLNVAFPSTPFPTNVRRGRAYIKRVTDFTGGAVSALTVAVGDAGDPDGLLTATNVFDAGAGYSETSGAAESTPTIETGLVPTLTLAATGDDVDALATGELVVCIPFVPLHD